MEVKVIATELAAGGVGNATATWGEHTNYRQTNKQKQEPQDWGKFYKLVSLVSCAVTPKTAPLVCNSQYSGTGRWNPVRKGGRQDTVKFWRQLKVSWGPGALALGLGACVRGSG